jgi:hypothetical protein
VRGHSLCYFNLSTVLEVSGDTGCSKGVIAGGSRQPGKRPTFYHSKVIRFAQEEAALHNSPAT